MRSLLWRAAHSKPTVVRAPTGPGTKGQQDGGEAQDRAGGHPGKSRKEGAQPWMGSMVTQPWRGSMVFNKHKQEGQENAMCLEKADQFDLAGQRPGPPRGCWDNRPHFSSLGPGCVRPLDEARSEVLRVEGWIFAFCLFLGCSYQHSGMNSLGSCGLGGFKALYRLQALRGTHSKAG